MQQQNQRVAFAGILMAGVMVLCRLASLGKEAYVMYFFGAGAVVDAVALAILLPSLGHALFLTAVRRAYLVQYPEHAKAIGDKAKHFTDSFLTSLFLVSVAAALVISGISVALLGSIRLDNAEALANLRQIIVPAAWIIVPTSLVVGLTTVLNARQVFSTPQIASLLPTAAIVGLVFAKGSEWGAGALIWGLLIGTACQATVLWVMVARAGHTIRPRLAVLDNSMGQLWRFSVPIIFLELMVQGNTHVDRWMATALLDEGKLSVLYWSATMKDMVSGTLVASLLTVFLPHFAEQVSEQRTEDLKQSLSLVMRYGAIFLLPISALLLICGPPALAHLKFGKLDPAAASAVSYCLAAYGLGLFGDLVGASYAQALLALRKVRALIFLGVFAFMVPNVMFNLLLIGSYGEVGLAISSALVGYVTLIANYMVFRSYSGVSDEGRSLRVALGAFGGFLAMVAVGTGVNRLMADALGTGGWDGLISSGVAGLVALGAYAFIMLKFPGSPDARDALEIATKKLRGRRNSVTRGR